MSERRTRKMTKKEFGTFIAAMRSFYPRETILPTKQAIELWFNQLQDIPYEIACLALNQWAATNKWSPSVAEIRESAAIITQGEAKDWGSGWEQVKKAISNFGMYRVDEAVESIEDEIAKETVKRIGFLNLCTSENPTAERANFRMIYEQLTERKRKEAQLPKALKELIQGVQSGMIGEEPRQFLIE